MEPTSLRAAAHALDVRWNIDMQSIDNYEATRKQFIEKAKLAFRFLCDEFGYSEPQHPAYPQPTGVVIADSLEYPNDAIDRLVILYNAYHPIDYGFEVQLFKPSVSTHQADRVLAYHHLKEDQDTEQTYLERAAMQIMDKCKRVSAHRWTRTVFLGFSSSAQAGQPSRWSR